MTSAYMPDVKVEVAFGSGFRTPAAERVWTDVSAYVELDEGITITAGRTDERGTCDANSLNLTLDNSDGRFTAGLASSPYYPNVKIGRPIRLTAAPVGGASITNPTFDVNVSGWTQTGGVVLSRQSTQFWEGGFSGRSNWPTVTAGTAYHSATISNLIVGVEYPVSVMAFVVTGSPRIGLGIGAVTVPDPTSVTTLFDQWQEMTTTFVATATTATLRVIPADDSTSGEFTYIDSVNFAITRFEGYVDVWPVEWTEGVSTVAQARLTASSRLARLGLSSPLMNLIDEAWKGSEPLAHYTMGEPEGATTVSDTSGNLAISLSTSVYPTDGAAIVFGTATGPGTDSLTAATFRTDGKFLRRSAVILPPTTADFTMEGYISGNTDTFTMGTVMEQWSTVNAGAGTNASIHLGVDGSESAFAVIRDGTSTPMVLTGTTDINDGATHHVAVTFVDATGVGRLYIDGVEEDTATNASWSFPQDLNRTRVGYVVGTANKTITLAHVAISPNAISAADIAFHAGAADGFEGETAALRIARYAAMAYVPAAEQDIDPGAVTPMQHIDTTDKTALSLAHDVETTEAGVLFDARDNRFTYLGRAVRYSAPTAFTLDMALQQVEAGVRPALDRTSLINEVTASTPNGEAFRVVNTASQSDYGRHAPGDLELLTTDPTQAESAANWLVNTYGEPMSRVPALITDVLALPLATQAALLQATVGTRFGVSNWPAQVGTTYAAGFFVEGYTESIGPELYEIALNVSPASIADVFTLNDSLLDGPDPLAY